MKARPTEQGAGILFSVYHCSTTYPNYALTNEVIKNVFVLISDSRYILKIPQVIPEDARGVATLGDFPFGSYEDFMAYYHAAGSRHSLFSATKMKMEKSSLLDSRTG